MMWLTVHERLDFGFEHLVVFLKLKEISKKLGESTIVLGLVKKKDKHCLYISASGLI